MKPREIEQFTIEAVRSAAMHSTRERDCTAAEVLDDLTPARIVALIAASRFLQEDEETSVDGG